MLFWGISHILHLPWCHQIFSFKTKNLIFTQAKTANFATFFAKNWPTNQQQCWLPPSSHTSLESSWTYGNFGTNIEGVWGWKSGARFFSTCPDWSGSLLVDCLLLEMLAHLKIIITSTSLPRAVKNKYVKTVQISFQNSIIFTFVPLKVTGIEACYNFWFILKLSIFLSVIYLLSLRKSESEQINLR